MTVVREGNIRGGLLTWYKYRVAVDLRNGDLLICDNQELHGNSAIKWAGGGLRCSLVGFYHDTNQPKRER